MAAPDKTKVKEKTGDEGLLGQIMLQTRINTRDEGYDIARRGVEVFLKELLKPERVEEKVDKRLVDAMIDELDKRLSMQMDEILHAPEFKAMESAWAGMQTLISRTDFNENTKVQVLNVAKEDLFEDFEDVGDVTNSGLYQHIYTNEYGQYGGEPVGVMLANYEFGPGAQDIKFLRHAASVGAMSHAPFISAAGAQFFGIDDYQELPTLKDLGSIFEGPQYAKWRGFREEDDARNVGLVMPKVLLRAPYNPEDNPIRSFNYEEQTGGIKKNYLWGNAVFSFGSRITDSFAKYRWCPNIIGPQSGGGVLDLPVDNYEADGQTINVGPAEISLSDRREFELSDQGFVALTMRKGSDNATFFSANTAQKPRYFGNDQEGRQAELNFRLGTQFPYLFIVNRLAHYLKVLQRENLGSWKSRNDLERELNRWVRQYVADQENPSADVRSRRPLRTADISVYEVDGEAGWYRAEIKVTPHFKFMGASFTLSLTGKLERV